MCGFIKGIFLSLSFILLFVSCATSLLITHIQEGLLNETKELLDSGADVNEKDENGVPALMWASGGGHTEIVKLLLEKSADVNVMDQEGNTALMWASGNGHRKIVKLLLEKGADVNVMIKGGNKALTSALMWASQEGHTEIVEMLLEKGADVDVKHNECASALMRASGNGHTEIVKLLLAKGADVNIKDKEGDTALILASHEGHTEIVKLLLAKGADVNAKDKDGKTVLMWASTNGHTEIVEMLLAKGADVNVKNKDITAFIWGHTEVKQVAPTLILASQEGHTEIVKLLLAKGADVNVMDKEGNTALMWASTNGHTEIVEMLLAKGADVNVELKNGITALMGASGNGHTEIAKLLLAEGADVNVCTEPASGSIKTPLIYAVENENLSIVKMLLESGALPGLGFNSHYNPETCEYRMRYHVDSNGMPYSELVPYNCRPGYTTTIFSWDMTKSEEIRTLLLQYVSKDSKYLKIENYCGKGAVKNKKGKFNQNLKHQEKKATAVDTVLKPYSGNWSKIAPNKMNWSSAKAYCEKLKEDGYSNWRLPTISELRTFIKNCPATETGGTCGVTNECLSRNECRNVACNGCSGASDGRYSKLGDTKWFWSSSSNVDNTGSAWYVYFGLGGVYTSSVADNDGHARCVR